MYFIALLLLTSPAVDSPTTVTSSFQIVVNRSVPVTTITKDQLAQIFFKRNTHWTPELEVKPFDQAPDSPVRAAFSQAVLDKEVESIKKYWRAVIFSGRGAPPRELAGDAAVLEAVNNTIGAIGYVSGKADTSGAHVLTIK